LKRLASSRDASLDTTGVIIDELICGRQGRTGPHVSHLADRRRGPTPRLGTPAVIQKEKTLSRLVVAGVAKWLAIANESLGVAPPLPAFYFLKSTLLLNNAKHLKHSSRLSRLVENREQAASLHHEKPELHDSAAPCKLEKQLWNSRNHKPAAKRHELGGTLMSREPAWDNEPVRTHRARFSWTQLQGKRNPHQVTPGSQTDHAGGTVLMRTRFGQEAVDPFTLLRSIEEDRRINLRPFHLQGRSIIR